MFCKNFFVFFLSFLISFCCSSQTDTAEEKRNAAIDNIASVLFDTKSNEIRQRNKAFEDQNGVKLRYTVDEQSIDKIGGLTEHLIRLFQSVSSFSNVNVKTITAEFSVLDSSFQLSDKVSYKTLATPDLRSCPLPLEDTDKLDILYTKSLQGGALTAEEINSAPVNLDEYYSQSANDYQNILYKHSDCPGFFDANEYTQHVINTRTERSSEWGNNINSLGSAIKLDFDLLISNFAANVPASNPGNTGVNLNVQPGLIGKYILNRNGSVNNCTQEDM